MRVDNLGFFIDKMGHDAGPLQFLRELTHNSIQAIGNFRRGRGRSSGTLTGTALS